MVEKVTVGDLRFFFEEDSEDQQIDFKLIDPNTGEETDLDLITVVWGDEGRVVMGLAEMAGGLDTPTEDGV